MAIKFSQFNLRTDHTEGMYLVGYDGNQNIHITVDNLFDDFINGTENTIAMFGTDGTELADSILSQDAGATLLTVAGQLNVDAAATFDTSIAVTGDSTLNGNVTLGDASTDLITQTGTLYLNGPVKDTTDTLGAVDQVLLSDATGELTFTDLADLHVGGAEVVEVPVKNVQGSALVKGDPVYISGSVGASGRLEVQLADASNALKMPAVGLLKQDLANNAQGFAVVTGKLRNLITDPIDGVTPTENDVIYVKPSGISGAALTTTKPVYGNFIQNIGKVGRVSTSNDGNLVVSSILRTNDIPNLTPGRLWIGSTGNTIESQTLFVDEANTRLGIGTTSPSNAVHVIGNGVRIVSTATNANNGELLLGTVGNNNIPQIRMGNSSDPNAFRISNSGYWAIGTYTNHDLRFNVNSTTAMHIESTNQNVGIGTTSPGAKLEVNGEVRFNTNTGTTPFYITRLGNIGESLKISVLDQDAIFESIQDESLDNYGGFQFRLDSGTTEPDFQIRKGSNPALFLVNGGGNVGIGTTSPNAKLEVMGGSGKQLRLSTGTTTYWELGRSTSTGNFEITEDSGDTYFLIDKVTGQIQFNEYGSGAFTGTATKNLAVDSSGNVIETDGSIIDGSGTANYVSKWSDPNTLTDSVIYDDGTNVGIGTTSPTSTTLLHLSAPQSGAAAGTGLTISGWNGSAESRVQFMSYGIGGGTFALRTGTSNTERLRVDSSGNVGIGTTSPGRQLELRGQGVIRLNATSEQHPGIDFQTSDTNDMQIRYRAGTDKLGFYSYGTSTDVMTIQKSNGYVGIGLTSPSRPLHVNGAGTNFVAEFQSTDDKASILIQDDDTLNYIHSQDDYLSLGGQNLLSADNLNINSSNGNVGIGTISPGQKLHINESAANTVSYLRFSNAQTTNGFDIGVNTSNSAVFFNRDVSPMLFGTSNAERMRIDSSGNVGIGVTSITAGNRLEVAGGTIGIDDYLVHNGDTTTKFGFVANNNFVINTAGIERVRVTSGGSVGINTNNPGAKLDVEGNAVIGAAGNIVNGDFAVAINKNTVVTSEDGFAQGENTIATGRQAAAFGFNTYANGPASIAGGSLSETNAQRSIAVGATAITNAEDSAAFNTGTRANGLFSFAIGQGCFATNNAAFASGSNTQSTGLYSFSGGVNSIASGNGAVALGGGAQCSGEFSFAAGNINVASGLNTTALGFDNDAIGDHSAVIGHLNTTSASGVYGVAINFQNTVSGQGAFAFNQGNTVSGLNAASGGVSNTVTAEASFAYGFGNDTSGGGSTPPQQILLGRFLKPPRDAAGNAGEAQVIVGRHNKHANQPATAFAVGTGTATTATANSFTVQYDGNVLMEQVVSKNYSSDSAAAAAGVPIGGIYHNSGDLKIRLT